MSSITRLAIVFTALLALAPTSSAQGQLVLGEIHGYSLEDSMTGESPDRAIAVYLPPSYAELSERHYPVLYLLHGIGGTHADWIGSGQKGSGLNTLQDVMDHGIAARRIAEMIVVTVDQRTRGGGSFYTNSAATGAWEDFTVVDLVDYADSTYRTLPRASSRGIAGHSMGGYGAIKLGMKYPEVFQVVYGMNSALLGFAGDLTAENQAYARAATVLPAALNPRSDFYTASLLCVAQAFSPNVDKPPFFADLPFVPREGRLQQADEAYERWEEHMPLYMVPEYEENLRKLRALRFDSGSRDEFTHIPLTNRAFSDRLSDLGIPHVFEDYNGDHRNRMWGEEGRVSTEVLPFFSRLLDPE
jgi:S-formylglutathione hydrolase FrmB